MPNGNGQGPAGMGPRSGRGNGFCNGNQHPGSFAGGFGRMHHGNGNTRRRGGGYGPGSGFGFLRMGMGAIYSRPMTAEETDMELKARAEYLKSELDRVTVLLDKKITDSTGQ